MARPRKDDPRYLTGELPRAPGAPRPPITMPDQPKDYPPLMIEKELKDLLDKASDYIAKFDMMPKPTPEELLITIILSRVYVRQVTANPQNLVKAKTIVLEMLKNVNYRLGRT